MPASIRYLISAKPRDIGGFTVRRLLPAMQTQMVGPFIFLDHMGPVALPPGEGLDVRPHPHIGLATVTYLFEGEFVHRDSLGSVQPIRPGDVNWMTAGRGIAHSERTAPEARARGARVHGLQTWVALPGEFEEVEPSFHHHPAATLPQIERDGVSLSVVAGDAFGAHSPVHTFTRTLYVAARMAAGSRLRLPAEHEERAVYAVEESIAIDGEAIEPGQLAVLQETATVEISAASEGLVMLVGGAKMDGRRFIWWNFVSSSRERIEAAKQDWREQRFGAIPDETEFIPLPETR